MVLLLEQQLHLGLLAFQLLLCLVVVNEKSCRRVLTICYLYKWFGSVVVTCHYVLGLEVLALTKEHRQPVGGDLLALFVSILTGNLYRVFS